MTDVGADRSVRAVLSAATATLAAAGVDSPRPDAEWLLAHVLRTDRGRLLIADDLDDDAAQRFRVLIDRRAMRVPLQHLTGSASFGPLDLAVGPGVFIPRPETELLFEWAVGAVDDVRAPLTVVDLCSGSGALAIAAASAFPAARVHAVELSPDAADWLRRNVSDADPQVSRRIRVHVGDATDPDAVCAAVGGPVDLIVSNPPYVPVDADVPAEVRADPAMAVFGGADGLSVIRPMVEVIARVLRPGGRVGVEHDDSHAAGVVGAFAAAGVFDEITSHADLAGRPRFVTARRVEGLPASD